MMDGSCRQCLSEVLAQKVRNANAPGATDQVKEECWAYMNRIYAQVSVHDLYPPRENAVARMEKRASDTI